MDERKEILEKIFQQTQSTLCDEETMQLLLGKKYDNDSKTSKPSFSEKAADMIARIAGSWAFIIIFGIVLFSWMYVNILFLKSPFDPYPFILLNLVLSCVSAFQAPLIMMAQNRQDHKDRVRARNDYILNIKTEVMMEDIYQKIENIMKTQEEILEKINNETN